MSTRFGTWRPIDSHGGPRSQELGLILHVTTNSFSPYGFFSNPANEASSTWWISDGGDVDQYVESGYRAWAQAAGNDAYDSVETSGTADQPMTDVQVEALAHLYAWGHANRGWPLQVTDNPGVPGLGWHGMGAPSWGHAACPGVRREQRQAVLDRARQILNPVQEDDSMSAADVAALAAKIDTDLAQVKADILASVQASLTAVTGAVQAGGNLIRVNGPIDPTDPQNAHGDPETGRSYAVYDIDLVRGLKFGVHPGFENVGAPGEVVPTVRPVTAALLASLKAYPVVVS